MSSAVKLSVTERSSKMLAIVYLAIQRTYSYILSIASCQLIHSGVPCTWFKLIRLK